LNKKIPLCIAIYGLNKELIIFILYSLYRKTASGIRKKPYFMSFLLKVVLTGISGETGYWMITGRVLPAMNGWAGKAIPALYRKLGYGGTGDFSLSLAGRDLKTICCLVVSVISYRSVRDIFTFMVPGR
jgi:hypothetical protein